MQPVSLFSAPNEAYLEHILKCKEKFEFIFPIFDKAITRILASPTQCSAEAKDVFLKMILFHDLGKLTKKWQENVGTNRKNPSHATLGAAYLWKSLSTGIKEPLSFAVAIHHTDRGLLGDNIERPDVQAILDGIANHGGTINWHDDTAKLGGYFPKEVLEIDVKSLKDMARRLRVWARGCGLLEQHERRLQAALAHHILKLCDISAAADRKEYEKQGDQDYYGGWLMVDRIMRYVDGISERTKQ